MNQMIRHTWQPRPFTEDVTVLITQRKTPDVTRLCLESLLHWYPDIRVLIVDGDSQDDSSMYLHMKASLYPNVRVHTFTSERHSHGEIMHMALSNLITSKYVLLMDSDVITMEGDWLEVMLSYEAYAIGTGMLVGIKAEGCGGAESPDDEALYIHPSLALIDREQYLDMEPFKDHGAPCISNMIDAKHRGLSVVDFPVEWYTLHLSGSSWTSPRTVWWHDNDVMVRPMLTVVNPVSRVAGDDIECIYTPYRSKTWDSVITWDMKPLDDYDPSLLLSRFNVRGEYVVEGDAGDVQAFREAVIRSADSEININGITYLRRKEWQRRVVTTQ